MEQEPGRGGRPARERARQGSVRERRLCIALARDAGMQHRATHEHPNVRRRPRRLLHLILGRDLHRGIQVGRADEQCR